MNERMKVVVAVVVGGAILLWWQYAHNGCPDCQSKMRALRGGTYSNSPGVGAGIGDGVDATPSGDEDEV